MYFAFIALTAACVVFVRGEGENVGSQETAEENESEEKPVRARENNTFVAIIDIVFVDNTKRTCTGAIIHDNVVITAAHCFFGPDRLSRSKPELTASFVVIGTKTMFDTGYEQYLPIERIVVHPKYEGWTADLALVYTFAAMTSTKPGTIIPLASEKMAAHLDSNVTVFSWGHARRIVPVNSYETKRKTKFITNNKKRQHSDESCDSDTERSNNSTEEEQNTVARVGFRNARVYITSETKKKKALRMENHRPKERSKIINIAEWFLNGHDGESTELITEKKKTSKVENKQRTQQSTFAMIGNKFWNENGDSVELDMNTKKTSSLETKRTTKRSTIAMIGKRFLDEYGNPVELDTVKRHSKTENKRTTKRSTFAMMGKKFRDEDGNSVEFLSDIDSHRFKKMGNPQKHKDDQKNHHSRAHHNDKLKENEMRKWTISRYLTDIASAETVESSIRPYVFGTTESDEEYLKKKTTHRISKTDDTKKASSNDYFDRISQENKSFERRTHKQMEKKKIRKPSALVSFKSTWRRNMGATQNRLIIETFGFVNLQTCRLLVDKALPDKYNISKHNNDVICYTNPARCVDERDSGAPAVRQGALVAITVGGAECEDDQVAVGMKMSCFCSWISDNLPSGATPLSCCTNCCDVKHKEAKTERRHRFRNRYI